MKVTHQNFATKKDVRAIVHKESGRLRQDIHDGDQRLEKKVVSLGESLREEMRWQIQRSEERTDGKAQKYRDQILTSVDGVMKELLAEREERALLSARVYNHEERIENLEKVGLPLSSPSVN